MANETEDRILAVPSWLHRTASWAWRMLVVAAALWVMGWIFVRLRVVIVPTIVALMAASVLSPLVHRLHRKGVPLLAATWLVLVPVGLLIAGVLVGAGWGLTAELTDDSQRWGDVEADVKAWLEDGPLQLSEENVDEIDRWVRDSVIGGVARFDGGRARIAGEIVTGTILTLALAFFFVKDGPQMWGWVTRRVHSSRRDTVREAGHAAVETLGAYLRAVALTGLLDAIVIGVGLYFIGVPLVIPLAIITFAGAFLPIVGATAAGIVAAVVALVANGPGDAVLVLLLTLVVQQLEGDVIMPVIMGRQVPLHPAAVLAALTAGGALAGVLGAFVAVPVAATTTAAITVLRKHRHVEGAPIGPSEV